MHVSVYVALLAGFVALPAVPALARRLPPRAAAWVISSTVVVGVGSVGSAVALLAATSLGQLGPVAGLGSWSAAVLRAGDPLPWPVAAVCSTVLVALVGALLVAGWRACRDLVLVYTASSRLGDRDVEVVDGRRLEAFALPAVPGLPGRGRGGRVVVSTGLLRAMDPREADAVLAHERAHLRHRHDLFLAVLRVADAVPFGRRLAREGAYALERWADEDAARAVGDRGVVARAIARVALDQSRGRSRPTGALAASGGPVSRRVTALLAPAPGRARGTLAALALVLALCCFAVAEATTDADALFDSAQAHAQGAAAAHSASDGLRGLGLEGGPGGEHRS